MRQIQSSEAKTHLPQLLDKVERGESFVITRHGRAIARLIPEIRDERADIVDAIGQIRALRRQMPRLSIDEILTARHEGHKY